MKKQQNVRQTQKKGQQIETKFKMTQLLELADRASMIPMFKDVKKKKRCLK